MNRKNFGRLVAALRQDLEWTQFQLAENGGLDPATISQIERGIKKYLGPELLARLANILQLTTLERREFFFAANGTENENVVRAPSAALATDTVRSDIILDKMVNILERLRVPAFLVDVYSDTVAVNPSALAFFQVPAELMQFAAEVPAGFNINRLVFGKEQVLRSHYGANWDALALSTMHIFRQQSLRYRAQPYFRYLIKSLRDPSEYPQFDRFWKMADSAEMDQAENFQVLEYEHETYGRLEFIISFTSSVTRNDELIAVQYLPTNDNTKDLFDRLTFENGQKALRLSPWPQKKMPETFGTIHEPE